MKKIYWLISVPPILTMGIEGGGRVVLTDYTDEESVLEEALNQIAPSSEDDNGQAEADPVDSG